MTLEMTVTHAAERLPLRVGLTTVNLIKIAGPGPGTRRLDCEIQVPATRTPSKTRRARARRAGPAPGPARTVCCGSISTHHLLEFE